MVKYYDPSNYASMQRVWYRSVGVYAPYGRKAHIFRLLGVILYEATTTRRSLGARVRAKFF
jgi:hypothetical protein